MTISTRMSALVGNPSAIVVGHQTCATDPWSETNPEGYLNFGIAENHLIDDILLPKLNAPIELTQDHIHYSGVFGLAKIRSTTAHFLEKYLHIKNIKPENIVIQSGVSSLCEAMSFAFFDEGDFIMIPTPYYTGFDHDFTKRFKLNFLKAHLEPAQDLVHSLCVFEQTYLNSPEREKVKAILLTHPHNPTGEILSKDFMHGIVKFAKKYQLQIICDEIYALSCHQEREHVSLYQIAVDEGVQAHLLYGMAKDFAVAGLKVGFYYHQDEKTSQAMGQLTYFHPVSTATQLIVENLLNDDHFIQQIKQKNAQGLSHAKGLILNGASHLKFIDAQAGLFMLLDLSMWCDTFADEDRIFNILLNDLKINFSKGADLGMNNPGYFRVCFARNDAQIYELIKRLKRLKRP